MRRQSDLDRFYELLGELEATVGDAPTLDDCTGRMNWPDRGVYFFLAPRERHDADDVRRVTRVGTHAVSTGSKTSLWDRLRTHRGAMRGTYEGGGNHRGSVFRKYVGEAFLRRDGLGEAYPNWGVGSSAKRERRLDELQMERRVSEYVRSLPVFWADVDDEPGSESDRAYVERNAIALLSNYDSHRLDARPDDWLGAHSEREEIRRSGLWNVNHVAESYDPAFLDRFEECVAATDPL